MNFVIFVLWPTLFTRFLIYLKLKNASYVQMQNFLFFLKAYLYVAYGAWTVHNLWHIL